jgi:hypothetical protein
MLLDLKVCTVVVIIFVCPGPRFSRIGGVMVRVLAPSTVNGGFESRSGQTNDYEIGISCFSAKHAALRRKIKDWLARNQDNVSEWDDMSIRGLLFQWVKKIQLCVLV